MRKKTFEKSHIEKLLLQLEKEEQEILRIKRGKLHQVSLRFVNLDVNADIWAEFSQMSSESGIVRAVELILQDVCVDSGEILRLADVFVMTSQDFPTFMENLRRVGLESFVSGVLFEPFDTIDVGFMKRAHPKDDFLHLRPKRGEE